MDKQAITPEGLNSLRILPNDFLPKNTIMVSEDIYEQMKEKPIEKWNFVDTKVLCILKSHWKGKD